MKKKEVKKKEVKKVGRPKKEPVLYPMGLAKSAVNVQKIMEAKVSPHTEIGYQKLPGKMIRITKLSRFLSQDDIVAKYGPVIGEAYCSISDTNTFRLDSMLCVTDQGREYIVQVDDVVTQAVFSKIVSAIKRSGALLHNLVAVIEGGYSPHKTIKI